MSKQRNIADLGSNDVIETTASGIDVTGTVTADGLTVDGGTYSEMYFDSNLAALSYEASTGDLRLYNGGSKRQLISSDGDISFYEDTGTTAKFFWDASAESLGIGQGVYSTTQALNLKGEGLAIKNDKNGSDNNWSIINNTATASESNISFTTGAVVDAVVFDHSGNVGIGGTPESWSTVTNVLQMKDQYAIAEHAGTGYLSQNWYYNGGEKYIGNGYAIRQFISSVDGSWGVARAANNSSGAGAALTWSESMRIDSSGNLLVGLTSTAGYTAGRINTTTATGHWGLTVKDTVANASMVQFLKADGTQTGALKNRSEFLQIGKGDIGLEFHDADNTIYPAHIDNNTLTDNTANLGSAFFRFSALYAANGTIQTSDKNLKQDIRDLSEAEHNVAVACKGLLKAFRFKDAVETKGDDARIHFGIIAQDLQAAFEAEGLNASCYGVFCSDTRTDEETGEVHTRLGVRYEELLAFIIAAI